MKTLNTSLLTSFCLLLTPPAFAAPQVPELVSRILPGRTASSATLTDRYARRCQGQAPLRGIRIQGTALWGTKQSWDAEAPSDERRSVLVSVDTENLPLADSQMKSVRQEGGRLVAFPDATRSLVGTVLQGTDSSGGQVEVAICDAQPLAEDPSIVSYRVEAWNPVAREWENPCLGDGHIENPRTLAVPGVWDSSGTRLDVPGKLTLACENGAISKCIHWGYKPWAQRDGQSLVDLHQACTRMARADYCGDGKTHTHDNTVIDIYDAFSILTRATESAQNWDNTRASFEASWAPDGATCLARTRDGRAMATVLQECPGRFSTEGVIDLGEGDRCTVHRAGVTQQTPRLRNRSQESP